MFKLIDNLVEKLLIKRLHKKREKLIESAIKKFKKANPNISKEDIEELRKRITFEANRIYDMADKSLVDGGIKRAKVIFWATAIVSTIASTIMIVVSHGTLIPLALPLLAATTNWLLTVATIPIGYNSRVEGGLESVIKAFERDLKEKKICNEIQNKCDDVDEHINIITKKFYEQLNNEASVVAIKRKFSMNINNRENIQSAIDTVDNLCGPIIGAENAFQINPDEINLSTKILFLQMNSRMDKLSNQVEQLNRKVDQFISLLNVHNKETTPQATATVTFFKDSNQPAPAEPQKPIATPYI